MMKRQEFYERAQQLRDQYKWYTFEGHAVCTILSEVFDNGDELSKEIEIFNDVGYEYREKYVYKLRNVLKELGIECDECWSYDGEKFIIRGARFRQLKRELTDL